MMDTLIFIAILLCLTCVCLVLFATAAYIFIVAARILFGATWEDDMWGDGK